MVALSRWAFGAVMLLMLVAMGGCMNAVGGRARPVVAEYNGLQDKSLAIVVFMAQANTDEFPGARRDITSFVANQFRLHMPTTRLLNPQDVMQWQDDTINWFALAEKDIGRHFSVDRVLYIEVLTYEAKSDRNYGDLQGQLRANCKIFEVETQGNAPAWSGLIDVKWPEAGPASPGRTNEVTVRARTLQAFAMRLVGYFYNHAAADVPLKYR